MPWKKRYHRLLKNDAESTRMMHEQMELAGMLQIDHYLPSLVRLVLEHHLFLCRAEALRSQIPRLYLHICSGIN